MRAGVALALLASLWAGSAAAGCVTANVIDVTAKAQQDQRLWAFYTGAGWSHSVDLMPPWMRARRDSRRGYNAVDLWGVPRLGTYTVSIRYTRGDETVICQSRLRFR